MEKYSLHKWILFKKFPVLYEWIINLFGYKEAIEKFICRVTKKFDSRMILDVGCGSGLVSISLAELHKNSVIIGIDKSMKMVKFSQKTSNDIGLKNTVFLRADLSKSCPLKNDSIDMIVTSGALEYIKLDEGLKELYRCIKKDGIFIIIAIKNNIYGRITGLIFGFDPYEENTLIEELNKAGFKEIERIPFLEQKWLDRMKISFIARKT